MKNIRKTVLFYLVIFVLSFSVFAQDIVKNPELPKDYEQWPNIFTQDKDINNRNVSCHVYFRKPEDGWKESLLLLKIDQEIIMSDYNYFQREENYNHGMTFPDRGNGYRLIHWALSKDYLQVDSRNFEEPSKEELERLSQQEIEKLAKRKFEAEKKLGQNIKRINDKKIRSFGLDPKEINDFLEEVYKEIEIFLNNLPES